MDVFFPGLNLHCSSLRVNIEKLLTVLTHVDDSEWISLWIISLSRCWPQLGNGDVLLCSHVHPLFFALDAVDIHIGKGGSQAGWEMRKWPRDGYSQEEELSELRTHLVSSVGNKDKAEPKANGWFSEKKEGGTSTKFASSHSVLGIERASWFWEWFGFYLKICWSSFPIFPPGFFPIGSDCIPKLSFHKQFLFSRKREIRALKGGRLITRAVTLGVPQEPSGHPPLEGQQACLRVAPGRSKAMVRFRIADPQAKDCPQLHTAFPTWFKNRSGLDSLFYLSFLSHMCC